MSLEDVNADDSSEDWLGILTILNNSCLDKQELLQKFNLIHAYKIINPACQELFQNKRNEFLKTGLKEKESETQYGFVIENEVDQVLDIVLEGIHTQKSDNNTIGYNEMGVYLSKHADVCLKHASVKLTNTNHFKMFICQYLTGKTTTAIPRAACIGCFVEPTVGFTCHVSPISSSSRDSIQSQFDKCQIYLYELDENLSPLLYPRHIIPQYMLIFSSLQHPSDQLLPFVETELSCLKLNKPSNSDSNAKLQRAIEQINSRTQPCFLPTPHFGGEQGSKNEVSKESRLHKSNHVGNLVAYHNATITQSLEREAGKENDMTINSNEYSFGLMQTPYSTPFYYCTDSTNNLYDMSKILTLPQVSYIPFEETSSQSQCIPISILSHIETSGSSEIIDSSSLSSANFSFHSNKRGHQEPVMGLVKDKKPRLY